MDRQSRNIILGIVALVALFGSFAIGYYMFSGSGGGSGSPSYSGGSSGGCSTHTQYVPAEKTIINSQFMVDPGTYRYKTFIVQDNWLNPSLEINIKIYQGRDVDIILLKDNTEIWESGKVGPAYYTTIKLPGVGSYEIRIDNSYSVITSKNVEAKVVLHYTQEKIFETCG